MSIAARSGVTFAIAGDGAPLDFVADEMPRQKMSLLNPRRACRRRAKAHVAQGGEFVTFAPCESDRRGTKVTGSYEGLQDVCRPAARADTHDAVAGSYVGTNLPGEDLREVVVVADSSQDRSVAGEGDGWKGPAFPEEAPHELGGDVLGIGRTAAVATKVERAAAIEAEGDTVCNLPEDRLMMNE